MALILNIDTALEHASVCITKNGTPLAFAHNESQHDHAAWLHVCIDKLFSELNSTIDEVSAVAVTIGPGSYTGLRVGLAAAKGFCYALNKPLITVGTLELMAYALRDKTEDLICPLIDARRMEVYAAVYDRQMTEIMAPSAIILNEESFNEFVNSAKVLFTGSGITKLKHLMKNVNASFVDSNATAAHLGEISGLLFEQKQFADAAYVTPLYIKDFYFPKHK